MSCERYVGALADYAAGDGAPPELEAHLASCAACRNELTVLRRALDLAAGEMGALLSAEPSAFLKARIRRATAEDGKPSARPVALGWLWPAVASALVLAVTLVAGRGGFVAPRDTSDDPALSPAGLQQADGAHRGQEPPRPLPSSTAELAPAIGVSKGSGAAPANESSGPRAVAGVSRAHGRQAIGDCTPPRDPDILVPPGEEEALRRFAADLQERRVQPDSLLVVDLSAPLPEPEPITIPPLEIPPLAIPPLDASGASGT
jgi:hypothetical protein